MGLRVLGLEFGVGVRVLNSYTPKPHCKPSALVSAADAEAVDRGIRHGRSLRGRKVIRPESRFATYQGYQRSCYA